MKYDEDEFTKKNVPLIYYASKKIQHLNKTVEPDIVLS